jgi:hypothetical protein
MPMLYILIRSPDQSESRAENTKCYDASVVHGRGGGLTRLFGRVLHKAVASADRRAC